LAGADALVEVDDVLVHQADAARRGGRADGGPFRRAVQAEQRVLALLVEEIEGARAERVLQARAHAFLDVAGDVRTAGGHFFRRMPGRPFLLPGDVGLALPGKALLADADAIAHGLAAGQHVIKEAVRRVDDDRTGLFL